MVSFSMSTPLSKIWRGASLRSSSSRIAPSSARVSPISCSISSGDLPLASSPVADRPEWGQHWGLGGGVSWAREARVLAGGDADRAAVAGLAGGGDGGGGVGARHHQRRPPPMPEPAP